MRAPPGEGIRQGPPLRGILPRPSSSGDCSLPPCDCPCSWSISDPPTDGASDCPLLFCGSGAYLTAKVESRSLSSCAQKSREPLWETTAFSLTSCWEAPGGWVASALKHGHDTVLHR